MFRTYHIGEKGLEQIFFSQLHKLGCVLLEERGSPECLTPDEQNPIWYNCLPIVSEHATFQQDRAGRFRGVGCPVAARQSRKSSVWMEEEAIESSWIGKPKQSWRPVYLKVIFLPHPSASGRRLPTVLTVKASVSGLPLSSTQMFYTHLEKSDVRFRASVNKGLDMEYSLTRQQEYGLYSAQRHDSTFPAPHTGDHSCNFRFCVHLCCRNWEEVIGDHARIIEDKISPITFNRKSAHAKDKAWSLNSREGITNCTQWKKWKLKPVKSSCFTKGAC